MKLLVLRHGQAADAPAGGSDIDRPLTAAGRRAARALQTVVGRLDPDLVLCSPALRTRQTLDELDLDPGVEVAIEPELYGAEADWLLDRVGVVAADVATVLVVGHNPGVHHLVLEVSGGERLPHFRPTTLAVLDLTVDRWNDVGPATGSLASVHVPDERAD